jgi:hypothetical protein
MKRALALAATLALPFVASACGDLTDRRAT